MSSRLSTLRNSSSINAPAFVLTCQVATSCQVSKAQQQQISTAAVSKYVRRLQLAVTALVLKGDSSSVTAHRTEWKLYVSKPQPHTAVLAHSYYDCLLVQHTAVADRDRLINQRILHSTCVKRSADECFRSTRARACVKSQVQRGGAIDEWGHTPSPIIA